MNRYQVAEGMGQWRPTLTRRMITSISEEEESLTKLLKVNSLTAALKERGHPFGVELLFWGERIQKEDKRVAREVLLTLADQPVVWAESQIISSSEESRWLSILDRGKSPLGAKLFDGSLSLKRTPFEYALIERSSRLFHHIVSQSNEEWSDCKRLIARRSRFDLLGEQLSLIEVYLPPLY